MGLMMSMERFVVGTLLVMLASGVNAEGESNAAFEVGYRKVDLRWTIAGNDNGCCPNILSELTWSDIQARQLKGSFDTTLNRRIMLEASAAYGIIVAGDNQDSDYYGDNRTYEFSRSNNDASDGSLIDLSVGVGLFLGRINDDSVNRGVKIYPKVGYSYHEQNFVMTKGYQTWPPTGKFSGLDSTYETVWQGPWLGLVLDFELSDNSYFGIEYQFHIAEYTAIANWNLRPDFEHPKSFEHTANGTGQILDITYKQRLNDSWGWGWGLLIENWDTDAGDAKYFFSDGSRGSTQLNEVIYSSSTLSIKADYFF
jgi:hypothetical protein